MEDNKIDNSATPSDTLTLIPLAPIGPMRDQSDGPAYCDVIDPPRSREAASACGLLSVGSPGATGMADVAQALANLEKGVVVVDGTPRTLIVQAKEGPDHAARTHHKNSPSKLPYLEKCPGFKSDETGDKDAAEKGTQLHEYMDTILANFVADPSKTLLFYLDSFCQSTAVDEEVDRPLLLYCVRELMRWLPKDNQTKIVHEIHVFVHRGDGSILTSGHLDVLILYKNNTALLIDYKFGWLPVKDAALNEQGFAYALGVFEKFPALTAIAVEFIQPRIARITQTLIKKDTYPDKLAQLCVIIERAEHVQRSGFTSETTPLLQTGDQCLYCSHSKTGTCPARLNILKRVAEKYSPVMLPTSMNIDAIDTPEKAVLARYWVDCVEDFLGPVKERARDIISNLPEQRAELDLPDGSKIAYKIQNRKVPRSVGAPLEVSEALKDFLTMEQVLACSELSLGRLEDVGTNAIFEAVNGAEQRELKALDERHRILLVSTPPRITKAQSEKERKALRAKYAEMRITKKSATEQLQKILTAHGLLSQPDGTVPALVKDKSVTKQIVQ